MSKSLADMFGWEEGAIYKFEELYYSVIGENLYYFKDFESPRIKFHQTINMDLLMDLLELAIEAERVEPKKYYLKHKFLGSKDFNYLNLCDSGVYTINDYHCNGNFKTKFTNEDIEKLEATGFDLCNFEKVEVEDE